MGQRLRQRLRGTAVDGRHGGRGGHDVDGRGDGLGRPTARLAPSNGAYNAYTFHFFFGHRDRSYRLHVPPPPSPANRCL